MVDLLVFWAIYEFLCILRTRITDVRRNLKLSASARFVLRTILVTSGRTSGATERVTVQAATSVMYFTSLIVHAVISIFLDDCTVAIYLTKYG